MPIRTYWLATAAIMIAAPLHAQTAESPAQAAADAREVPQTAALNDRVDTKITTTEAANAEARMQYEADKLAYLATLRANHREIAQNRAHYEQQQAAYAAAMRDWRAQALLCKKGHRRACDLPTPDPANYM